MRLCKLKSCCCDRNFLLNAGFLCLFFIGLGIFMIISPAYADDFSFVTGLKSWFDRQGVILPQDGGDIFRFGIPMDEIHRAWQWRDINDNCRLSNRIVMFFLLLPKWVGSSLSLLGWIYGAVVSLRYVDSRTHDLAKVLKSAIMPVVIFSWVYMIVWGDHMSSLVYQFNYVLPTGLAVLLLVSMDKQLSGKTGSGTNIYRGGVVLLLSLVVGSWNEAFTAPLICGLGAIALLYPRLRRNLWLWGSVLCLFAGMMWIMSSPNFGSRADHELLANGFSLKFIAKDIIMYHPSVLFFFILLAVAVVRKGWSRYAGDPRMVFIVVSSLVSLSLSIFTSGSPRAGWWGNFACVVGLLALLYDLVPAFRTGYRLSTGLLGLICLVSSCAVVIPADAYVVRMSHEFRESVRRWRRSPDAVVFADVESDYSYPGLARLWLTQWPFWEWHPFQNSYYYGGEDTKQPIWSVVPKSLREFTPAAGRMLGGDARVMQTGDWFLREDSDTVRYKGVADIRYGNTLKKDVPLVAVPFVSAGDGRRYSLIVLYDRWWEYKLFGVSEISDLRWYDSKNDLRPKN